MTATATTITLAAKGQRFAFDARAIGYGSARVRLVEADGRERWFACVAEGDALVGNAVPRRREERWRGAFDPAKGRVVSERAGASVARIEVARGTLAEVYADGAKIGEIPL